MFINWTKQGKNLKYRGFTLTELLIVMLICSILMLGINAAYHQAHKIWSGAEDKRPIYQQARRIIETLREELTCLYIPSNPQNSEKKDAKDVEPVSLKKDELAFFTLNPCWKGYGKHLRPARVRYLFSKTDNTEKLTLERRERPYSGELPIGAETSQIVATGLSDIRITPAETEKLTNEPNENSIPRAINISLSWSIPDKEEVCTFESTILIPTQHKPDS